MLHPRCPFTQRPGNGPAAALMLRPKATATPAQRLQILAYCEDHDVKSAQAKFPYVFCEPRTIRRWRKKTKLKAARVLPITPPGVLSPCTPLAPSLSWLDREQPPPSTPETCSAQFLMPNASGFAPSSPPPAGLGAKRRRCSAPTSPWQLERRVSSRARQPEAACRVAVKLRFNVGRDGRRPSAGLFPVFRKLYYNARKSMRIPPVRSR